MNRNQDVRDESGVNYRELLFTGSSYFNVR